MKLSRLLIAGLLAGLASVALAQTPSATPPTDGPGARGPRGPHGPRGRGIPPVVAAVDLNKDGVLSADEIAKASASLLALDTNKDGKLSFDELHPNRPANAPTPPPGAPPRHADPVMLALDANGDGELSAQEIANASTSLKALDTNHDGQLTLDELRPLPPKE